MQYWREAKGETVEVTRKTASLGTVVVLLCLSVLSGCALFGPAETIQLKQATAEQLTALLQEHGVLSTSQCHPIARILCSG